MKICVATGTRAEYGLLKPLIDKISQEERWQLQVLVTGAHLSPEFGLTFQEIVKDGISIDAKVEMLLSSDSSGSIVKSMGLGMIGFADALTNLLPDLLVILGDRYEMLALASSALILKIPIAHVHGGEVTEGAYDDAIRHSITKMSHLHFAATEVYRKRIIQLGENPSTVFTVGAIGLDNVRLLNLLSRKDLETKIGVALKKYNYLVTFHPPTLDTVPAQVQLENLLSVIDEQEDSLFIFTKANADTDGRIINEIIDRYVERNSQKAMSFTSMGQLLYLSTMQYVTAVVGNSSSGIVEAPYFKVPTINIGNRQKGRIQASTIVNCQPTIDSINKVFSLVKDVRFLNELPTNESLFGDGSASEQIVKVFKELNFKSFQAKSFFDTQV